jgi:hypothetical protein
LPSFAACPIRAGDLGVGSTVQGGRAADRQLAAARGRTVARTNGINIWTGLDLEEAAARVHLEATMRQTYGLPLETFERWSPAPKALERFREEVRRLTRRTAGKSLRAMVFRLDRYLQGCWGEYLLRLA